MNVSKNLAKVGIGLLVVFAAFVVLPMVAQAQFCKYVGPTHPVQVDAKDDGDGFVVEKELFFCYNTAKDVPDDKTLQDFTANRDKIGKNLVRIVEIEILVDLEDDNSGRDKVDRLRAVRCVKELDSNLMWFVKQCEASERDALDIGLPEVKKCTANFGNKPYVGGPIQADDPLGQIGHDPTGDDGAWKVNKEVFRCFESGDTTRPLIYDVLLVTEFAPNGTYAFSPDDPATDNDFVVIYCVKDEVKAKVDACAVENIGVQPKDFLKPIGPFLPGPDAFLPILTVQSTGLRNSAGRYEFVAQGYHIESVQVNVYDQRGRMIFSDEAAGNSLSWTGLSADGRRLANGVYFYTLTVKGTYGDAFTTKVQKLALLR